MATVYGTIVLKVRKIVFWERGLIKVFGFDRANAILKKFKRALI